MNAAALLARHWPFANGSGRFLDKFANGTDLGSAEQVAVTSDRFPMHVFADDLIGRHLLMSGKFDRSIVQMLLDQARPGDVLVDVGANIGYVSACFLSKVADSRAICIEPQPGIADLLRKNMKQFGHRAEVKQFGLADREGVLRFHVDTENRGASRIADDGETEITVMEAAKVFSTLARVDLIKIDVEGYEEPIFRSMTGELKRLKPRAILFEDQTRSAGSDGALGSLLSDYRIFGIDKKLMATRLAPIYSRADCRYNDYLALLG